MTPFCSTRLPAHPPLPPFPAPLASRPRLQRANDTCGSNGPKAQALPDVGASDRPPAFLPPHGAKSDAARRALGAFLFIGGDLGSRRTSGNESGKQTTWEYPL
jgi:hypothetical protein